MKLIAAGSLLALPATAYADGVAVHGSVQTEIDVVEDDKAINTPEYDQRFLFNLYADVNVISQYVEAGLRFEFMKWPTPQFLKEPGYAGWGFPNVYVKGKYKGFDLTVGDFYDQFGSGFIFRTYEERTLGIDNSIRGARLNVNAVKGLRLTVLGGQQRHYWEYDWNWASHQKVFGANAEAYLQDWWGALRDHNAAWMFGASYVLKHEKEEEKILAGTDYRLNFPKNVNAFDVRSNFQKGPWSVLAEFAWKGQDPSFDNNFTYGNGTAVMISGSYARKGLSAMLQAKRSENMSFRSERSASGLPVTLNYMPAFSYQHTYALAALYPYATQMAPGEWAFQGAFEYTFKRRTPLGGKYGTKLILNASYISGLVHNNDPKNPYNGSLWGTDGYKTDFWKIGACNYYDFNVMVEKKFSQPFYMQFMYAHQYYNNKILTGAMDEETPWVRANVLVADARWKINRKFTLRGELQYLFSNQDYKDWAYGLVEFSFAPYLQVSVSDMWNTGKTGLHYYMFAVTGNYKSNRLMISYGRTRQGVNCTGGVCRTVPAMHGLQVAYSYNF